MNSFSPGPATILYYFITVPIALALSIISFMVSGSGAVAVELQILLLLAPFPLWYILLRVGRTVRNREQTRRQVKRDRSAAIIASNEKAIASDDRSKRHSYVLYLRPFTSTGKIRVLLKHEEKSYRRINLMIKHRKPETNNVWGDLETTLTEAIEPFASLIALGKPGEYVGAGRIQTDDLHWKDEFIVLANNARQILIVPSTHDGTKWELDRLFSDESLLGKTVFIIPPTFKQGWQLTPTNGYRNRNDTRRFDIPAPTRADNINLTVWTNLDAINAMKELKIELPNDIKVGGTLLVDQNPARKWMVFTCRHRSPDSQQDSYLGYGVKDWSSPRTKRIHTFRLAYSRSFNVAYSQRNFSPEIRRFDLQKMTSEVFSHGPPSRVRSLLLTTSRQWF